MDKYTASNGWSVLTLDKGAGFMPPDQDMPGKFGITDEKVEALREFFQAERDEELGRWRWPANPNYVVYPRRDGAVLVLNEMSVNGGILYRRGDRIDDIEAEASCAYFEAHPEPKPWDSAKPGEVWVLTVPVGERPANVRLDGVMYDEYGNKYAMSSVTAARRIWPESD